MKAKKILALGLAVMAMGATVSAAANGTFSKHFKSLTQFIYL